MAKTASLMALTLVVSACATMPGSEPAEPATEMAASEESNDFQQRISLLEAENVRLRREARRLGEEAAIAELSRLASSVAIQNLEVELDGILRQLSEARAEVVRGQAKLRGSVGQADAAANIAEAQLAIDQANFSDPRLVAQSRSLLGDASIQFDAGNFGGALYLSSQAKDLVDRVSTKDNPQPLTPLADETPFAATLRMVVTGDNINIRSGPGEDYGVIATLKAGTEVDGYSHKGVWVRVWLEDGSDGWVYQQLVTPLIQKNP